MDGPPPPEEDFSTIPILDRIVHKNWKARLHGYEALPKLFSLTTSDSDPAFRPYLSDPDLLKKIVTDSNAVAQEKGVEALCALVEYSGENSAKTRAVVVPALVDKCLGSTRAGTKTKAIELILKYIGVENSGEGAVRDLIPGLAAKQPKVVSGTVTAMNEAFKAFGIKVIPPKEALKTLPKIFGHQDKNVRAEGTALVQTLYTWLGPGIQPFLSELKPVQVKELGDSFEALDKESAGQGTGKQTRWTRVQEREREAAAAAGEGGVGDAEEAEAEAPPDPRLLMDEVDITPKLPENFYTGLASSKWKERKEALDTTLEVVAANPRIKDVDAIGDLAKALAGRMTDANIQCVMTAAQIIGGLAEGIGSGFGRHRGAVIPPMLERFKERKQNVVDAIGQGLDAVFETTTLPDVTEYVLVTLKSKNPQVKEGTAKFLARCLSTTKVPPAKGDLKPMAETLASLLEDGFEPVRAAAAEGLGSLLKIVGERQLNPFLDPLDDLRKAKVKEAAEKATVKYKAGGAPPPKPSAPAKAVKKAAPPVPPGDELLNDFDPTPKAKPPARLLVKKAPALAIQQEDELKENLEPPRASAPSRFAKQADPVVDEPEAASSKPEAKVPARLLTKKPAAASPATAAAPAAKKLPPSTSGAAVASKPGGVPSTAEPIKYRYSSEDAEALAVELIPPQMAADLGDANWKIRLAALEEFSTWLEEVVETAECEVLFRFLSKKPGWNEKNFQVSAKVYGAMGVLAEKCPSFSKSCVAISTGHLSEKLGDMKLKKPAGDVLLLFAEKTSLSLVLSQGMKSSSYDTLSKQKAPKVLADSITWIGQALADFGIAGLSLRSLVDFLKEGLKNSNATVRSSATSIKDLLQDLNPQLLATIDTEFAKVDGQSAPVPTRFSADVAATSSAGGKGKGAGADALDELFPRVDLDKLVAGTSILADAKSEAWKARKEALELLQSILDVGANKRLKPTMGDIGQVLKARVGDSNKTVQVLALDIICRIASGMNKPFEKYTRFLARPVAEVLADQKSNIRNAGTAALTAMATACEGIESMVNPLAAALETANPLLRSSLLQWMAEWFKSQEPSSGLDLGPWAGPIVTCLDDKNGDVRKGAQAILPFVIAHIGIDPVMAQTNSLKPASRSSVIPMIQTAAKSAVKPKTLAPAASQHRATIPQPTTPVTAPSPSPEPSTGPAAVTKRPATNLRLRKIEPSSRSESRAESINDAVPSSTKSTGATKSVTSHAASTAPSSNDSCPFSGTSLDAKRVRLAKDGPRWVVEGLPVPKDLGDILQHQMERCTSKDLLGYLFSKDHNAVNAFVKGLGIISDAYSQVSDEEDDTRAILIANSDLAFKYVSTKIHEPQPNLIGRCLDVLDSVIALLTACDYTINDQEAMCFIPTIIHKLGDGRETVRVRVQNIMHNLPKVYPSSRLFQLTIDHGLKSKIAKTRQGALEELGNILKRVGISACEPTKAFAIIASMIGDKDPSVRKAALSTIGEGYVLAGEKIWQYVGALSPKDKTQLEERLKRTSGPSKPPTPPTKDKAETPMMPQVARLANAASRPGSPAFPTRTGGIPRPASPAISLSLSTRAGARSPNEQANRTAQRTPSPQPTVTSSSPSARPRSFLPSRFGQPRSRLNPAIGEATGSQSVLQPPGRSNDKDAHGNDERISPSNSSELSNGAARHPSSEAATIIISSILSSDPSRSVDALKKIQKTLDLPPGDNMPSSFTELADHADGLIETIVLQMSHVFERPEEVAEPGNFRLAKHLIQTLNSFCDHAVLAESLPVEILTSLLEELTMRLLQTDESLDANVKDLSKFINMIVLRIFATGRRISVFRALFALLLQITKPFPHNGTTADSKDARLAELVLKCVWKMARTIPQELNKGTLSAIELFPAIEQFLQSIPPNEWRQRAQNRVPVGDMPLRTTKVIIQHIVAVYPDQVYDQLSEAFDDPSATIVYPYVYRILNTTPTRPAQDERTRTHTNGSSASGRSISPPSSRQASPPIEGSQASTPIGNRRDASLFGGMAARANGYGEASEPDPDARLNEIIDHISSDTTGAMHKEGITELHHFIKEYPHKKARVDHMLDTTGPAFRKYIARALASRAAEDEEREVAVADTLSKLESAKRPVAGIGLGHPGSRANEADSAPAVVASRRISASTERRFSTASEAPPVDDKVLSRLHDIFQYQGRSSISSTNRRSISGEPLF
ncbi:Microtubule-associated protein, microtubule dynamics during spindle orientation [Tulasnella sp. 331]|nr:Microtubule-associated protein, microtubule dynamics during spindle orientation [Tulasnella sp. 331]KAG8887348.1 Microtubule-associated protein, microtubule dynamics during spindle orientation [Tulasnella sp. 332]